MKKSKSILLVEDNPDDIELTLRAFKKSKLLNKVDVVSDGEAALEYLKNMKEKPTLMLLDLKLPKIDGLEVLRRIRADESVKLLPVVVLTSSNEERDIVESYKLGANSFVRKPVDLNEFIDAVKELGLYWLILNEGPYVD